MTQAFAHVEVLGQVHGVGYREFTRTIAQRLGLAGWVRNRDDGCVEVAASGNASSIEALLAAHDEPDSRLDRPAAEMGGTVMYRPIAEGPGALVGPYKLLQQIGEGGFGTAIESWRPADTSEVFAGCPFRVAEIWECRKGGKSVTRIGPGPG